MMFHHTSPYIGMPMSSPTMFGGFHGSPVGFAMPSQQQPSFPVWITTEDGSAVAAYPPFIIDASGQHVPIPYHHSPSMLPPPPPSTIRVQPRAVKPEDSGALRAGGFRPPLSRD
jgi:hypothetical protein